MLNIFKAKLNNKKNDDFYLDIEKNDIGQKRHYPPANKEWFNSTYSYNKNSLKLLYTAEKVLSKLIKSYFNFYSSILEKKIKSRRLRRWQRRLSVNRVLVSKPELKHTNDKVIITLYVYNRQKKYYLNKIRKINIKTSFNKIRFMSKITSLKTQVYKVINKEKKLLLNIFKLGNDFIYKNKSYEIQYYKHFIYKSLHKEMLHFYIKQIILFNKLKFENTYLLPFTYLIEKIYNKNVEFNIISLKYLHLNSNIFSNTIAQKLKNRKNRLSHVLRASLRMVKLPYINKSVITSDSYNRKKNIQNVNLNLLLCDPMYNYLNHNMKNIDALNQLLLKLFPSGFYNKLYAYKSIEKVVLGSIKYKSINGVRLEASGRLSKRITAARSISSVKYTGGLKTTDSSYKRFSSVILRGNERSNLQFTKAISKTRIGSFGIKGWVSSK